MSAVTLPHCPSSLPTGSCFQGPPSTCELDPASFLLPGVPTLLYHQLLLFQKMTISTYKHLPIEKSRPISLLQYLPVLPHFSAPCPDKSSRGCSHCLLIVAYCIFSHHPLKLLLAESPHITGQVASSVLFAAFVVAFGLVDHFHCYDHPWLAFILPHWLLLSLLY